MLDFPYLMSRKFKKKNVIIFNLVIKIFLHTNSFINNFIIRFFYCHVFKYLFFY